jgi:ATP phosphoribosyltransferase
MSGDKNSRPLRLGLPKGRMKDAIFTLLKDSGIEVSLGHRGYRPTLSIHGYETKILKPQNIVEMLHIGSRDIGFAGADWVTELQVDLVELLDTGLNPVQVVAAAPVDLLVNDKLPAQPLVIASEYERLTKQWIKDQGLNATFVHSYGATEVFPPEDADCIIDNTATGSTLRANKLQIIDELMTSSTRLYANPKVLEDKEQVKKIDDLILLLKSVLEARRRVMLEVNVSPEALEAIVKILPCMREPTISTLHGGGGFAIKAAVPCADLPHVIPKIKAHGGTDIVVTRLAQIIS